MITSFSTPFSQETLQNLPKAWSQQIQRQRPDRIFVHPGAHASLWINPEIEGLKPKTALIGHFHATSIESGEEMLTEVIQELRSQGYQSLIGPIDGSTWNSYRFITHRGDCPPFFMESQHPEFYLQCFLNLGFKPIGTYYSSIVHDLKSKDPRLDTVKKRLLKEGVQIRPWDPSAPTEELRKIYSLSLAAFQNNFLYSPLEWSDFYALYEPFLDQILPEFVLIAEVGNETVGFVFTMPDREDPAMKTFIIKTLAILPGRRFAGLGSVLVEEISQDAADLGMTQAIHAYMHEKNHSRNIGNAVPFREYQIFALDF